MKDTAPYNTSNSVLMDKTQYIQHLRHGDSRGLPEVREVQIMR